MIEHNTAEAIAGEIVAACDVSEVHVSPTELKLMEMIAAAITKERQAKAELERRLGIAVERLQSMSSAPGSYPRQWFIATAEYALNEIRAKEGEEG
jgi:hypothetical protein